MDKTYKRHSFTKLWIATAMFIFCCFATSAFAQEAVDADTFMTTTETITEVKTTPEIAETATASAETTPDTIGELALGLNTVWMLLAAMLVFFMQPGFALVEAGFTRVKNTANILMKNFVKSIPHEITESGKIDGAGDMKIFTALILPMLKPALATIGLFLAIGYWNEWYQSSLFLSEKMSVYPLQYTLYKVVNKVNSLKSTVAGQYVDLSDLPSNGLKMANAVLATGPVILLYPFVQRYFIGGITVGAVKG